MAGNGVHSIHLMQGESHREKWTNSLDFLLTCLGYAVGLGNVWRFPTMTFKNGGGAFFIPYWIMLFFVGMPIFLLEVSIGQFISGGPTKCWEFCPISQGLGFGMTIVSMLTACYYQMLIAWCLYMLIISCKSFTTGLPWDNCDLEWSSETCIERLVRVSEDDCMVQYGHPACFKGSCSANATSPCRTGDGVCMTEDDSSSIVIWDANLAHKSGCSIKFPAMEYFVRVVLKADQGSLKDIGAVDGQLLTCLALSWVLVAMCLIGGIKASGKIVYVTATAPYFILGVLFIRGLLLDGAMTGIEYYLYPRPERLLDVKVWKDAAVQIFFSLSASYGGLITLASYNWFHNNIHRDTLIVTIGNSMTSVFAGFVIFSFLGYISEQQGMSLEHLSDGGTDLVFGVYPFALAQLPAPSFWSVLFFILLIMLGLDSEFVLVETGITGLVDNFPKVFRKQKYVAVILVCLFLFLLGIPMATPGGAAVLTLLDTYSGGWNVLIIAFCECLTIIKYGPHRFIKDLETMIGGEFPTFGKYWWVINWSFFTPLILLPLIIASLKDQFTKEGTDGVFDYFIGMFLITFNTSILIPTIFAIYHINKAEGNNIKDKFLNAIRPSRHWGPAFIEDRLEVSKNDPGIIVNPYDIARTGTVEP